MCHNEGVCEEFQSRRAVSKFHKTQLLQELNDELPEVRSSVRIAVAGLCVHYNSTNNNNKYRIRNRNLYILVHLHIYNTHTFI